MNEVSPQRRGRGRPRIPPERQRRPMEVRLPPSLLQRLETAAAAAERSVSREIEWRCQLYEDLLSSGNGPIQLLLAATTTEAHWTKEHTIGSLARVLLRLPHHDNAEEDEKGDKR